MEKTKQVIAIGNITKEVFALVSEDLMKELKKAKIAVENKSEEELRFELIDFKLEKLIATFEKKAEEKKSKPVEDTRTEEEKLKEHMTDILTSANELRTQLTTLKTPEERTAFLQVVSDEMGAEMVDYINKLFPDFTNVTPENYAAPIVAADDLPISEITGSLPIRVLEQVVYETLISKYPLTSLITMENVRNGIKQIMYKDYRDGDDLSGYSDVTIADYNKGTELRYSEMYKCDTNWHKGYDILDSMLNDVTLDMALFISLINDYVNAISKPLAKFIYSRLVDFLATDVNYDEVIELQGADTKAKAKELNEKLITLSTPSRDNLKVKPNGSAKALEYALDTKNTTLVLNKKYATNYKFDLAASTFQLAEITIPVGKIIVLDFDAVEKYATVATPKLKEKEILLIENGVYNFMTHFSGEKTSDTAKLKTVKNFYMRVGDYRRKDKIMLTWKNKP